MNYITLKEAAKATGLNEMTIRRLCKKPESKPFIKLKDGRTGPLYTIQTNYLFDKYPPKKGLEKLQQGILDVPVNVKPVQVHIQEYTPILAVKDELIQFLKEEIAYLREENKVIREENKELKLLPAAYNVTEKGGESPKKSFWQRIWNI